MRDNDARTLEDVVHQFLYNIDPEESKEHLKDMLCAYIGSDLAESSSGKYNAEVLFLYFQLCDLMDSFESHRKWLR